MYHCVIVYNVYNVTHFYIVVSIVNVFISMQSDLNLSMKKIHRLIKRRNSQTLSIVLVVYIVLHQGPAYGGVYPPHAEGPFQSDSVGSRK